MRFASSLAEKVFWGFFVAILITPILVWIGQPNAPSILEEHHSQQEQSCTQSRQPNGNLAPDGGATVHETYEWTCDPEEQTTYNKNDAKEEPGSSVDADLLAQERVAYWTKWIGVFTALGLFALVLTFYETRAVGRRQTRAYIGLVQTNIEITLPIGEDSPQFVRDNGTATIEDYVDAIPKAGSMVSASLVYRNFGNSPAHTRREGLSVQLLPASFEAIDAKIPALRDESYSVMGDPQFTIYSEDKIEITEDDSQALKDGRMVIAIRGRVEYVDMFGAQRFSNFLYYRTYKDGYLPLMIAHKQGNEST